jgi:uncharacterized membrane protein
MNSTTITRPRTFETTATARPATTRVAQFARIHSIDIVRGFVIMLMALDHVRDYFSNAHIDLLDPTQTTVGLYITRWITHLCAPTFIFLAGVSAQRLSTRMATGQLSRYLMTRGLWMIALEVTVVLGAWSFNFRYDQGVFLQVMWAIGASMLCLAALVHLPIRVIGIFGAVMIATHNLLDPITPAAFGAWSPLWTFLHARGPMAIGFVSYPLIPWIGVMALGFAMGTLYDANADHRRTVLRIASAAALVLFVVLRLLNVYGDPHPWEHHATLTATLMSFFDVEKYPPSLLYLLATLGIAWRMLAAAETLSNGVAQAFSRVLETFGRVPLFFYVLHIVLAHLLAGMAALAEGFGTTVLANSFHSLPKNWGWDLPLVYCAWLAVLLLLYPACVWFGELKRRRTDWWLAYL